MTTAHMSTEQFSGVQGAPVGLYAQVRARCLAAPQAVAIRTDERNVSYGQMLSASERIAGRLIAAGVAPGDAVGIVASRSPETVMAMLGVLGAGAAYVPLDPGHARESLGFMAEDLGLRYALVEPRHGALAEALLPTSLSRLPLDELAAQRPDGSTDLPELPMSGGEDLACVLYTSGTTGQPKGVRLPHRAVLAYVMDPLFDMLGQDDVCLHGNTIACDTALWDIWAPLLRGASLAIVMPEQPSLDDFAHTLATHTVTAAIWYAGVHNLMIDHRIEALSGLRLHVAGGDVMSVPHARRLLQAHPEIRLINNYGPTETVVGALYCEVTPALLEQGTVPIGRPYAGYEAMLLDDDLAAVPQGETGQLAISGAAVALGYHNRPERTAASFRPDPRPGRTGDLYLTGDLARQREDGNFDFLGRFDRQVKIAGHRVELDGLEHVLRTQPGVQDAAVVVVSPQSGQRRIAAAVVAESGTTSTPETLRADLSQCFNPAAVPQQIILVDALPLSATGKVDRRRLAAQLEEASVPILEAVSPDDLRDVIAGIWAEILGCGPLPDNMTFFEAGGTSIQLIEAHARIEAALGRRFPITQLFQTPRLGALVRALGDQPANLDSTPRPDIAQSGAIAITGMAARLPECASLDAFWQHIREGRNLIRHFAPEDLETGVEQADDPTFVAVRPSLEGVDLFDAKFFGVLPREAQRMDPQARVFLEICQQALEHAGIDPARAPGPIGVYAGASQSTYLLANLLGNGEGIRDYTGAFQLGDYHLLTGNVTDSLSTRVAHKLDLRGPAMSIGTACSTSLTAIAQGVQALRSGMADTVLAGGVSITFPQKRGYHAQEGGMAALDGVVRPFDADACGTVFGHGAGVVVLRRLEDAQARGDTIHAVIRGVGLNNDGADKISYTAPSVDGQAGAIRMAHHDAGVVPKSISLVECHGTATPLGDPIEIEGLSRAFGSEGDTALNSVKGNIGHLDAAAGVVSVIKTAMALTSREIPPVANFAALNPRIDLAGTPFRVPTELEAWASDGPRRAGISSFGVGGTNVHLVLEEAPVNNVEAVPGPQALPLSAKSPEALLDMAASLADALEGVEAPSLAEAARTLQDGRSKFPWRLSVAAESHEDAVAKLRRARKPATEALAEPPGVVFMFPGQGAQYPGMGRGLYHAEPEFARWIDRGAEILRPIIGEDITGLLTRDELDQDEAARALRDTRITQPALFLTEYACARLWQARGIDPAAMIGHSVGEFAAAALAGVMSFEVALKLIATRGQAMQDQPQGAMLSVRAPLDALAPLLDGTVDLAATNAPQAQVVAGPFEAIEALEARLSQAGLPAKRLHTSHAFHSAMMDPVVTALETELSGTALAAPKIPLVSAVTGTWMTEDDARSPAFWARQARAQVNFQAAVSAVCEAKPRVLLEVGPGGTLSAFSTQTLGRGGHGGVFKSLTDHTQTDGDCCAMASAFCNLWSAGVPVDWSRLGPRARRRAPLPGTAFQRLRYWVDPPAAAPGLAPTVLPMATQTHSQDEVSMVSEQSQADRGDRLTGELLALFSDLSGEALSGDDADVPFLELGFDSLFMGQVSQAIAKAYGVDVSFRSLLADTPSVTLLAAHLDDVLPPEAAPAVAPIAPVASATSVSTTASPIAPSASAAHAAQGDVAAIMQAQLDAMQSLISQQLQALGQGASQSATPKEPVAAPLSQAPVTAQKTAPAPQTAKPNGFKTGRGPDVSGGEIDAPRQAFIDTLAARYSTQFAASKAYADAHRSAHADPRTCAGFRPEWKELTFPLVVEKAHGAYLEDRDGNRLIDLVNGFGQTAFGHSPDFVSRAVTAQIERGYPIGPQSDIAGPIAERFARITGHERVTFCNTGSEAVMAAMRLARAVTGREKIVVFGNDYHGQFDEVLVKGRTRGGDPAALPIAPGIPRSGLANMTVLPYDTPESLEWIRANAGDVAAVLVEPVQSRHPALRPAKFVRDLRELTTETGSALIMDEVVTGFRTHIRGMQGVWDITPDMATYGKVVGGGMPIGVLAGNARFMDALDGGAWEFGDASAPETAPTFFAGTFVRHPLVLAAVDAVLEHLDGAGAALFDAVPERTAALVAGMRAALSDRGLPDMIESYSSWFVVNVSRHDPRASLLFALMRLEGVHVLDGFCAFLTTAHTDADCAAILDAFETALDTLQSVGILAPVDVPESALSPAAATGPTGPVALTAGQREIWMSHQLGHEQAISFNEGVTYRLEGPLDAPALQAALDTLEARHDALRMRFDRSGRQFDIAAPSGLPAPLTDLSGAADPQGALDMALETEAARPIDLVAGSPIRAALYRLGPECHVLAFNAHHIACDGWSYGVLAGELAALYAGETLDAAPSFGAHAVGEGAAPPKPASRVFWQTQFDAIPDLPELALDAPRPAVKDYSGATVIQVIDRETLTAARKAGAKQGCTLFATLFAALQITIGRLAGASDVVLAVPTGGQAQLPNPNLVGHCVNLLPIRAPFDPAAPAAEHLSRVAQFVMDAFEHQDTTYGALLQDLDIKRSLNRMPLTEVQFNYERRADRFEMGSLSVTAGVVAKRAVNFDLFFNMADTADGLSVEVDYNAGLFAEATIQRWIGHFRAVLIALADDVTRPVQTLSLMTPAEEAALVSAGNDTDMAFDRDATLNALLERKADEFGARVAIEHAGAQMSYQALDARADALAALIQHQLPEPGARVAVALPRGADMLAALIGVLKAGHAYVPLDPEQPPARLQQIVETAEVSAVLCDGETPDWLAETTATCLDVHSAQPGATPDPRPQDPDAPAYVIFTSGSTGTPKGVEIPHRALVNFLTSMLCEPGLGADDSLLAVTTVMFDIAALELFGPLLVGGRVIIADRAEVLDGFKLAERIAQGDITVMQATPTLWSMLLEAGFTPCPEIRMLAGGEPISADLAERLMAGGTLWNMYGPTETTIWSAIRRLAPNEPITIGGPIGNTELHVLSEQDALAPVGVLGELNIGGDGLARGYFNRPDLTQLAFRDVTLAGRARRLYRTGDLAMRLANGEIRVLGRSDSQVKLRGFRIELGEIETSLRTRPEVHSAAVAVRARENGDKRLVAYIVAAPGGAEVDHALLREALAENLPDYMVPQAWVTLSELPQTANGKLDRKALPDPDERAQVRSIRATLIAQTDSERQIAKIWSEVLGLDEISVSDSLHQLGADSLAVFRIAARLLDAGLGLEARDVLANPSIRALAAHADTRESGEAPARPSLRDFRHGARRNTSREA